MMIAECGLRIADLEEQKAEGSHSEALCLVCLLLSAFCLLFFHSAFRKRLDFYFAFNVVIMLIFILVAICAAANECYLIESARRRAERARPHHSQGTSAPRRSSGSLPCYGYEE